MSRRYELSEQDARSYGGSKANRHKVSVKVCMLDDSVVKFDLEVRTFFPSEIKLYSLGPVNDTEMLLASHLSCQFCFLRPSSVGGFRTTT